jgi:hypothetical protein
MQPGSPTNIRVIIAGVVTGIVAVPVPGIIIVIPVPGTVISVIAVVEMRSQIPGIVEPGIPIPRIIIQGAIPIAETPRPVIPGIVVPGAVISPVTVIIPHIPGPISPRIFVSPSGGVPDSDNGIVFGKTDHFAIRHEQRVSSAKDIGLGGVAVCQQVIQFFGRGSLLGYLNRTGVQAVVESLLGDAASGRA